VKPHLPVYLLLSFAVAALSATPGPIPLWPEGVPGTAAPGTPPEMDDNGSISHVQEPTLTIFFREPSQANGTAIIVCPGGGYRYLSFRREGIAVAEWLRGLGVSATATTASPRRCRMSCAPCGSCARARRSSASRPTASA
jgi:hypothetical protein